MSLSSPLLHFIEFTPCEPSLGKKVERLHNKGGDLRCVKLVTIHLGLHLGSIAPTVDDEDLKPGEPVAG